MNKILYLILIVFLGLGIASGIWIFIFGFRMGPEIVKLESYVTWLLVGNAASFIGSILLLKYYYDKNYRFVFFTGIIAVITFLGYAIISYVALTTGQLSSYLMVALLLYLCSIFIYSTSLAFSNARKRFWLKLAGIWGMVVSFVLVLILFESMHTKDAHIVTMLHKITLWSPFAGYLIDVLFILNFVDEIRTSKTEHANVISQKFLAGISGAFVIAAVVLTITTARSLITERNSHIDWRDLNALQANGLVALAGGAQTYVDSKGDSLHYILIKPQDYDTQKKYPLVVCLPYGGYEAGAAEALSSDVNRHTYHAFIFVPFCPEGEGWGGISGYPSMESLVYEAISKLNEPAIDTKRRYVTGVSRGGFGTWEFICTRPDLFAAAVPVCGRGDPDLASKVVKMPIWAFHGAQDKNVPVSGSRDMIAAIKKAGGHPLYTEYPNSAHDIWENVIETPDVWNWLFAQKQK